MFERAGKKLGLDQAVLYGFQPSKKEAAAERKELENLIKHGAWHFFKGFDADASRRFGEADIDQILGLSAYATLFCASADIIPLDYREEHETAQIRKQYRSRFDLQ
jgi:hypothetical protein